MSTDPDRDQEVLYESDDDDQEDLLGTASNFRWRIHITSAETRRLIFSPAPIKIKLHSSRLPRTILDFRRCVTDACASGLGKAFRVRSTVWPTSAFAAAPVPFSRDKWFVGYEEGRDEGGRDREREIEEDEVYRKLLESCANYSKSKPAALVVFDIDVHFLKKGKPVPK